MAKRRPPRSVSARGLGETAIAPLAPPAWRPVALTLSAAGLLALPLFVPATFFVAWFALTPFLTALQTSNRRFAFLLSLLFGWVYHGLANYWLVPTVTDLGPFATIPISTMKVWALLAFVVLLFWQGLFAVLFGALTWLLLRQGVDGWRSVGIGACWLLTEWLRSLGLFGYPWALLASSQVAFLPLLQSVAWVGSFGLGGILSSVNALWLAGWQRRKGGYLAIAFSILAGLSFLGWVDMERITRLSQATPHLRVAVVQGNFGKERWRPDVPFDELKAILWTHLRLSAQAARQGARLIVWSETALPWRLRENGRWGYGAREIQLLTERYRVALLVGAGEWWGGKSFNACFFFAPQKAHQRTDVVHKIRLVPFGEFLPWRERFPWLAKWLPHAPIETTSGTLPNFPPSLRLDGKIVKPATLVCFESLFPFHLRYLLRTFSRQSPPVNLVVILTNDSWFGNTLAPYHHARVALLRAVEFRRAVVRGAGTGISLIALPTGKVVRWAGWNERRVLVANVPLLSTFSVYSVLGDLPFVLLAGAIVGWLLRRR